VGLSRSQAVGRDWSEMFPDPEAKARLTRLLREGEPLQNFETVARRADETLRDVLVAASPLRDESGRCSGAVGIVKNISELKAARGHLIQAEKLTALGEVVSGVAHELNNPLAGVLGYAQLLMRGPIDPRHQRSIERILESALRCQRIVQNLLAFSRRYPSEKKHIGLNDLVDKTLDLKDYELRVNNIQVRRDLQPDLPQTMLDFNQIQQVLLNLINNAQYAIQRHRGQGTLLVMTRCLGGAIQLRVQDDGAGIAREDLPKIFDPFFTTKPVGEGTGLGLSISYGIVRDHGGRIWAESEKERGTTLVLELPIRCEAGERQGQAESRGAAGLGDLPRDLRILVVDDEPVIRDLLVDALSLGRHTIETAAGGGEALRRLEAGHYDLVLLDLKMPDMDGRQVFEIISSRWPQVRERVIFASGDTVRPETRAFIEKTGRPCVDKPFRIEALTTLLAEVVGGGAAHRPATGTEGR
jgi:signal transduction histidine kinase